MEKFLQQGKAGMPVFQQIALALKKIGKAPHLHGQILFVEINLAEKTFVLTPLNIIKFNSLAWNIGCIMGRLFVLLF